MLRRKINNSLLYLSDSTRAVIGQFSGPYSPVRPLKFRVGFIAKLFLAIIACKSFKLSFPLNFVLERANDLKTISN